MLPMVGAILAIVGAILVIVACAVPYVHYTDASIQPSSLSVFNTGTNATFWYALEPVVVALIAIGAAILLLVSKSRILRAVASGALLAFGVQTFLLFVGYAGFGVSIQGVQPSAGGFIGMAAAVLILVAGVVPTITLFGREHMPAV
jgi:hypothetical protein